MYFPQKSLCIVLSRGTEVVVVDVQKYIVHEVIPPLILSSPQERPVLELECGSVPALAGNEISAAESQNFPLNDLICLPQKEKAFQACLLAASESSYGVNLMKYKSLQKKTWKVLLCFQLLRQNTSYSLTVPRKKKLNIIIYVSGQKNLPCLKFYFLFPGNGKDLKTSSNQKKTKETWQNMYFVKKLWYRLYADEGTFPFCGVEIGSKSVFERRVTTGSGSTFFPFNIPPS